MIHQNFNRVLYVDVNDSRKNFEIMIYYLKNDKKNIISSKKTFVTSKKKFFSFSKRKNVKLIMFLNWIFILVEKKYWFIELKMIELIWLIKRIRHLIEIVKYVIVIYTNHATNLFITRQTKLINNNVDKFNIILIRVFVYLS